MAAFFAAAVIWPAVLIMYFLPVLVGRGRHVRGLGLIAVINLFAGWTVFGWIAAMGLALRDTTTMPLVQIVQLPPPPPAPPWQPGPPPPMLPPAPPGSDGPSQW
jgi:Superinfection immunity protein